LYEYILGKLAVLCLKSVTEEFILDSIKNWQMHIWCDVEGICFIYAYLSAM